MPTIHRPDSRPISDGAVSSLLGASSSTHSWLEVNKGALVHNIMSYQALMPESVSFGIVVKANAYGHGMVPVAQAVKDLPRISYFLVASLSEAVQLRQSGIEQPILVMSYNDLPLEYAFTHNIHLAVVDEHHAQLVSQAAAAHNTTAHVHIKVDTGLGRLGIPYPQAFETIKRIVHYKNLNIIGIFTHFADSESDDLTFAKFQQEQFATLVDRLAAEGITFAFRHTSCTAAISAHEYGLPLVSTMVRLGLGTYGLWPSVENKALTQAKVPHFTLKPVLTWKAQIIQVKEVPAGSSIGYDRTYTTTRPTKLALLPVGYADGLDRRLSNTGSVLINDHLAPIVGRVAMNVAIVDVTDIPQVTAGDVAILMGPPPVSANQVAAAIGTISYEVVARINPGLPRVVIE